MLMNLRSAVNSSRLLPTALSNFLVLSAMATGFATNANASATTHTIKWRDMPMLPGQTCEEAALALANRLESHIGGSVAGFEILESRCVPADSSFLPRNQAWTIEIAYEADEQLARLSTDQSSGSFFQPSFKDRDKCESALMTESPVFGRQTGLKVFLSYCKVPAFASTGWEAIIEGYGQPANKPFSNSIPVFGTVLGHDLTSFKQLLADGFSQFGVELAQAEISSQMAYTEMIVRYYGAKKLNVHGHEVVSAPTKELCMAEVAGLTAALANSNVPTMGVFCWAHRMEGSAMLEVLTDGDNALRMTTAEENFETWEACVAARDNIADLYRTRYKHQVIAALCHRDPSTKTIKVKLLEKPRT